MFKFECYPKRRNGNMIIEMPAEIAEKNGINEKCLLIVKIIIKKRKMNNEQSLPVIS